MSDNYKNFTEEQAIAIAKRQKCRCAVCGKIAAKLTDDDEIIWIDNIHHKKPKSAMTKEDIEKHGVAGGIDNGVLVHQTPCHDRIHAQEPELAKFRTLSRQKIGETEADLQND